ncbi:signal peptide peptidase-like 2B-like protein [Cricetulus griseus]|uniref:Signal peptide peptidase-like 2B-like protein n=1 Tax=Cricetulus griseus TaxID=10029 RepID=A0A061HYI6_CRIGR|nr:signal peptide peptidase-like 2B-like protein [Cricetulus griseus]
MLSDFWGDVNKICMFQVACEFGVLRVVSQSGGTRGKDYCILYNPQWARLPHDLSKVSLLKLRDLSSTQLCSNLDLPVEDLTNQIALVARGNCTFYEKVRLAQASGARALLIVSKEKLVPPGGNKTQYEEISIPVALLSHRDLRDIYKRFGHAVMVALYAPKEPVMDYNMVIIFLMAVGTVALGGYWAGSRDVKKWAWVLQDVLGIAFCLYMLKTIRLPTFKACTMLLLVLFFYDVFFVFITPFLTKSGNSIMVEVATGPSNSSTQEKLPMVLKVPRLNTSPLALCDRPFSLLGFGDILVPGLLVAYCHRFDIQVQSSRIYFMACTIAYGLGLLVTFVALVLMQRGQPALLYLVPCTLISSCTVALWRQELGVFWTGSGFAVNTGLL